MRRHYKKKKSPPDKKCLPILRSKERKLIFHANDSPKEDKSFEVNLFATERVPEFDFAWCPIGKSFFRVPVL